MHKDPEARRLCKRRYYLRNRARLLAAAKVYVAQNRARVQERKHAHWLRNKSRLSAEQKIRREANRAEHREYCRLYMRRRLAADPIFRLRHRLRARISNHLRGSGWSKLGRAIELIGCPWETLKAHLESKFQPNMTWENMGEWHIDHIVPLCSAKTEAEVYKLCHYTNLQPLWAVDNLKKGGKHDSAASTPRT